MTTARSCVRPCPRRQVGHEALSDHLRLAALLPEAPRWGRGLARFSPRFHGLGCQPRPVGATRFVDAPQRWGVAPHVEHQVVKLGSHLPCLPSLGERGRCPLSDFGRTCRSYWMISVVCSMTDSGMLSPRALAVFKLMEMLNFVGCSIGRSAGLAPLRILSTW